jgi:putative nucleotidyltransferase with HDIG domain
MYSEGLTLITKLQESGYIAYFAGGCVRDMLLNIESVDYDIATSARSEDVLRLFPHCHEIGAAFGIISVVMNGAVFEVATFREEREYSDGRHPESITYCDDPALDAKRRDFTINAMFYDPISDEIYDFECGKKDLKNSILRCVGSAQARFSEDYLRILRAVRFAIRFDLTLNSDIKPAIVANLAGLKRLSVERVRDELNKMLIGKNPDLALDMLYDLGILDIILPEVVNLSGVEQPKKYHPEGDVFVHTKLMLKHMVNPSVELAWTILLHDIGKPDTFFIGDDGVEHFYNHEHVGADIAEKILKRFKFSKKEIKHITESISNHMRFGHVSQMRTPKLKRLLAQESFPMQLELHRVDCISSHAKMDQYNFLLDTIKENENQPIIPEPFINGRDLISIGIEPGIKIGKILAAIFDKQLNGEITSKDEAMQEVVRISPVASS